MKQVLKFTFLLATIFPIVTTRRIQFFRRDYSYIQEFDAFYKIHWDLDGWSWNSAFLACENEGAMLFYPKVKDEWTLVKNLTDAMPETPNVTDIFVGYHDEFNLGEFITVDGHATSSPLSMDKTGGNGNCVLMNINTGLFKEGACVTEDPNTPIPYVCKRVESESCPTIDQDYKHFKSLKKCYKINKRAKVWDEALRTCYMEGGLLTVIQNEAEANVIMSLANNYWNYHVGVRQKFSNTDFYTVKGQRFDEVYQREFPDHPEFPCGSIEVYNNNIRTTVTPCDTRRPFICEMEVTS